MTCWIDYFNFIISCMFIFIYLRTKGVMLWDGKFYLYTDIIKHQVFTDAVLIHF